MNTGKFAKTEKTVPQVFDRNLLRQKRRRAAKRTGDHGFLHNKTAEGLFERLMPVKAPLVDCLVWGGHTDRLCRLLKEQDSTRRIYWADLSPEMLSRFDSAELPHFYRVAADEEFVPFKDGAMDAVFSNLTLHSVNDLKGSLLQIRRILKPERPFMAALFGGATLAGLRQEVLRLEMEQTGGVAPRIFPFTDIRVIGDEVKALGFVEPVTDSEYVTIDYPDLETALADLRGTGEGNILLNRDKKPLPRKFYTALNDKIKERGKLSVEMEIIYMIGWSPS